MGDSNVITKSDSWIAERYCCDQYTIIIYFVIYHYEILMLDYRNILIVYLKGNESEKHATFHLIDQVVLGVTRTVVDNGFVLGLDFGGTKMAIATANAERRVIRRTELRTGAYMHGLAALHEALNAGRSLVEESCAETGGTLQGIGIATMGITLSNHVVMAPNVPGWQDLRIEETVRGFFPNTRVRMDNDVKTAALGELKRGALVDVSPGLYVNLGTGIAVAYTLGDQVLGGRHGAAGEIAYCLRRADEQKGFRDGFSPVEDFLGGRAIGARASEQFAQSLTAADLFRMAETDTQAHEFVDAVLKELAFQLTNLIIAWDPEKVVIGGGLMGAKETILPYLDRWLQKFVPFPPLLSEASFLRDAGLHGAIELAWWDNRENTQKEHDHEPYIIRNSESTGQVATNADGDPIPLAGD